MPKIPEKRGGYQQQSYSDPTVQNDGSGMVNAAISKAAGQVADFSTQLLQKRKQAEDSNFAFDRYMKDFEAVSRYEEQLKVEEGANPENYATKMKQFVDERMKANMKDAPSSEAQQIYNQKALPLFTKSTLDAENYQNIKKAEFYFQNKQENVDAAANALLDNPNYVKAKEIQDQLMFDYEQDVELYGENVAKKALIDNKNKLAMATLDGLEAKGRYGEALNLLKDNEAEGKITNDITPETKAKLIKRYENGLESKRQEYTAELRRQVQDKWAAALQGNMDDTGLAQLETQIDMSPMKGPEKLRLKDQLAVAKTISPYLNSLAQTPTSQFLSPEEVVGQLPGNFNESQRIQARGVIAQAQMRDLKMRENDGAGYILRNSPEMQNMQAEMNGEAFVERMFIEQQNLGIKNSRPLPVERVKASVQAIESGKPEEIVDAFNTIKQNFGKHSGAVIGQMVKDGKMNKDYILVANVTNPQSMSLMIQNIKNEKQYNELIKNDGDLKTRASGLNQQLASNATYNAMSNAMLRSNNSDRHPFVSTISNHINLEAKRRITLGETPKSAVDGAVETVFTDNFFVTDGNKAQTIVPRNIINGKGQTVSIDKDIIDSFVTSHATAQYLEKADLRVPADYLNLYSRDMDQASAKKQYYKNMSKDVFWDLGSDMRSLVLKHRTDGGASALFNSKGEVIRKDLAEIMLEPDEYQVEQTQSLWQRMFKKGNKAQANE